MPDVRPDTRSLNVALLTHSVHPRGGVVHVLELGRSLQALGHRVTVFAPAAPGQTLFRATPCRVERVVVPPAVTALHTTVTTRIEAMRDALRAAVAQRRYDVLHAHDGIGANALADLVAEGRVPGYLRTVHHVDRFADARVQALEERSIRAATRVLCVSALWTQRLRDDWGLQAEQVANGVDLLRYTPAPAPDDAEVRRRHGVDDDAPLVLSVGGIEARKNTRRLLAAFVRLRGALPRVRWLLAGGASLLDHGAETEAFRAELAAAGLADSPAVRRAGTIPDAELPALYRRADVLAMPSLLEGFGLAALEALACGTPAVVSRIAPFTEHFGTEDAGHVHWADPLQPESIAAALQEALAAPRPREVPAVCRRHDWTASARRHVDIYRAAAAVPPRRLPLLTL